MLWLLVVSYKLYCNILNDRLSQWVEDNDILADEQNGFRQERSTVDQLSSLTNIIDVRKKMRKSTFCAFIDFSKAYDTIDRQILWDKIRKLGIVDTFCHAIMSIYTNVLCSVRLNGHYTDWFTVNSGLKQGCPLSPILFNLYINDLVSFLQSFNCGVEIDGEKMCILLYADDVVLIASDEKELQTLLDGLSLWCKSNGMNINASKSNVVHFRQKSCPRSDMVFRCGDIDIQYVSEYKYLGLVLNEFLDYNVTAKAAAASASRALGLVIAKCKFLGGVSYDVFTKLFDSLVSPIIEYGAGIWGFRNYSCVNALQHRACRFFLGVGKYAPNAAVLGDMGWKPIFHTQWTCISRLWCRLCNMSSNRWNRKIFKWADNMSIRYKCVKNWNFYVHKTFNDFNLNSFCNIQDNVNTRFVLKSLADNMLQDFIVKWKENVQQEDSKSGRGKNKLRTYRLYKKNFLPEFYCKIVLPYKHRSAFAKFRCGVAPLRIETGRYENVVLENRVCFNCNVVEDELHVLLHCPLYNKIREELFYTACDIDEHFRNFTDSQKIIFLFSNTNITRLCAKTCYIILTERRNFIYCK